MSLNTPNHLRGLNFWYWLGALLALTYGFNHLFRPEVIAQSWGFSNWAVEETVDFVRLLGVWILFQSFIAGIIAYSLKDIRIRYFLTVAHVFKNAAAFLLRLRMWTSGRYDPITSGFKISTFGDLLFAIGYGYFLIFPEKEGEMTKRT